MGDVVIVPAEPAAETQVSETAETTADNSAIAVAAAVQAAEASGAAAAVAVNADARIEALESRVIALAENLTLRFDSLDNAMREFVARSVAAETAIEPEPEPEIIVPEPVPVEPHRDLVVSQIAEQPPPFIGRQLIGVGAVLRLAVAVQAMEIAAARQIPDDDRPFSGGRQ